VAILHVEDQQSIREVVGRALRAFGFAVVSADGVNAAKLALAERDDVRGALLDVRLRDGSGVDLYHWIVANRPDLARRVVFLTGSATAAGLDPLAAIGCPVLRKPFEIADLVRVAAGWEGTVDTTRRRDSVPREHSPLLTPPGETR
jgi:DNA-binding response OmpR family regulator